MKTFYLFTVPVCGLILFAQNTTQVLPTDAQRAAYWRAMYEMRDATCTADKAVDRGTKVIQGFCPAGQMISTATPATATTQPGEPSCVVAAGQ